MIKLTLKREIILDDNPVWMTKEDWYDWYENKLPALKAFLEDDILALWEAIGGFDIVEKAEWVDAPTDSVVISDTATWEIPANKCAICGSAKSHWVCAVGDELV